MADVLVISVSRLASEGLLAPGGTQGKLAFRATKGSQLVAAYYTVHDRGPKARQFRVQFPHQGSHVDAVIDLVADETSGPWWFVCPNRPQGTPCNRQVAKLYLPPSGRTFGCRFCYGFTYGHLPKETDEDLY